MIFGVVDGVVGVSVGVVVPAGAVAFVDVGSGLGANMAGVINSGAIDAGVD